MIRWDEAGLHHLLAARDGAVGIDLERRCIRVENAARRNASGRPGPRVDTGHLRSSIRHALGVDGTGIYGDIGSDVEYADYLERGTSRMPPYPYLGPALSAAG